MSDAHALLERVIVTVPSSDELGLFNQELWGKFIKVEELNQLLRIPCIPPVNQNTKEVKYFSLPLLQDLRVLDSQKGFRGQLWDV